MILVDTSVLIDYLRTKDAQLFALMQHHAAVICGIIRAEVLCGAQNPGHRQRLVAALNALGQLPIPDAIWDTAGDHLARMRATGITLPFPDVIIATLGIENDIEVWARDQHFPTMQKVLPQLRLFQESP